MLPYKPRLTSEILEDIDVRLFVNILIEANKNLAIYKTKLENSKTPWKLLSPLLMVSESLCSSRIEGTQTTLDEVLEVEANNAYMNADVTEVVNYYEALKKGEERLKELPISTRLIKELHEVLLSNNARGKNKSPGEY
ncbi:MAG: Fic family protein, partial [Clostridioides sp.]|nr:Fic family protein [Clostridioides sp.]